MKRAEREALAHHRSTVALWQAIGRESCACPQHIQERRRQPRYLSPGVACRLEILRPGGERSYPVVVQDVGPGGASLLCADAVGVARRAVLHPPAELQEQTGPVSARILSCRPVDERFRLGISFVA